jgi:hypothetical protein
MSALKLTSVMRNLARYTLLQPRNINYIHQYATKIDPPKKSSHFKLLLIGVTQKCSVI